MPPVPAGWFPDPYGTPMLRYWNGTDWTEQTAKLTASEGGSD
jgi:hypothetical protein